MNWELICTLTGIMLFTYWLNYCMGSPMADEAEGVDVGAILFDFPRWLANRRLRQYDLQAGFRKREAEELLVISDPVQRQRSMKDHRRQRYAVGREFFTWERSILCPICLHWWLTVGFSIFLWFFDTWGFLYYPGTAALTYLVNHLIIRKIS